MVARRKLGVGVDWVDALEIAVCEAVVAEAVAEAGVAVAVAVADEAALDAIYSMLWTVVSVAPLRSWVKQGGC